MTQAPDLTREGVRTSSHFGPWSFASFEDATPFASQLVMDAFRSPRFCTPPPRENPLRQDWFQCVAFHHWSAQHIEPACFVNFIRHRTQHGDVVLHGAVCTQRDIYKRVSADARRHISQRGGLYFALSQFAFGHLQAQVDMLASFGHCGDAVALNVNRRLGYTPVTEVQYLIERWFRPMSPDHRLAIIGSVQTLGVF